MLNTVQEGKSPDEHYIWVARDVVTNLLKFKEEEFSKDKLLMNLDKVRLHITPALQQKGYQDLYKIAKKRRTESFL